MSYRDILKANLILEEGKRSHPYMDTVGKITIGVGRNLTDNGLRDDEIDLMLDNDMHDAEIDARVLFQSFDSLSDARKAVLVDMAFNLGRQRLAGFGRFRSAVEMGEYEQAADDMLESLWATQVGQRAIKLSNMMRKG